MERFSLGKVLGTGFRVWFRNLVPFLLITALVYAPLLIWAVVLVQGDPPVRVRIAELERLDRAMYLTPLLNILVSAALVYGVVMELKGEHASMVRCLGKGLARFFPVLGVALLTALAVMGGLLLLIVPGLIMMCMLYVATGAAVLERPGLLGALARSRELTAGHRWEIFGILFLLWLIDFGLSKALEAVMVNMQVEDFNALVRRYVYVGLAHTVLMGSLSSVMSASAYYHLRYAKEGTSADELSQIFA